MNTTMGTILICRPASQSVYTDVISVMRKKIYPLYHIKGSWEIFVYYVVYMEHQHPLLGVTYLLHPLDLFFISIIPGEHVNHFIIEFSEMWHNATLLALSRQNNFSDRSINMN